MVDAAELELSLCAGMADAVSDLLGVRVRAEDGDLPPPDAAIAAIHPDDRRHVLAQLGRPQPWTVAYRETDGSGGWIEVEERGRIVERHGRRVRLRAVVHPSAQRAEDHALAQYRAIVQTQHEWITRQDPSSRYTFVNDAYCRYMGMSAEALTAADYDDYATVHPDDYAAFLAARAAMTARQPTFTIEMRCRHPDGSPRIEQWTETALFDESGAIVGYQAVGRDLTDQRRAERALRESEAQLRAIVDTQREWIVRRNAGDKHYCFVNDAYCRYMGMTREQLCDPSFHDGDSVVPVDLDRWYAARATRTPDDPAFTIEIRCRHPDGSLRVEEWTEVTLYDAKGTPFAWQASGRDITEQRRAEEQARQGELRFRTFAEAHPVPLCALRRDDWRVLFVNPAYLRLFGLTRDELDRADKRVQWADPEARAPYYERVFREGRTDHAEVVLRRKDGSIFPAAISSRLMELDGVDAVVNSVVDLGPQREAEALIARQREALHQSEKLTALGSMLAGVAHELNNPLSVVTGYAAMLAEEDDIAAVHDHAARIKAAAERCTKIVRTFLGMVRQKPPSFGPVDLRDTARAALELGAYALRSSGIVVDTRFPERLPHVHGDADQLHQVLANLVVNATQALQETTGPRRLALEIEPDGETVRVIVQDNGPGIPPEVRRRLFEPFFTTKSAGRGTGLGLAVCHGIVTAHGGRIEVESAPGEGTRMIVVLPVAAAGATTPASDPLPAVAVAARILVVEDEPDLGALIRDALARDGHVAVHVADGAEALRRLEHERFDLVITDLRMPGMDGAALLRALRTTHPQLAENAILLTGDMLSASGLQELQGSGVLQIEKPIETDELRAIVRRRLAVAASA